MIDMTAEPQTLLNVLEHCDMVEIDGLYAFEFSLYEDDGLHIELMDGRVTKHWEFTPEQVRAATFDQTKENWVIKGDTGEHRLVCKDAFGGSNDEDETE